MRILLVNKFLYPKGGAEIVCLGLADWLRAAGHEVQLFGMEDGRNPESPDADCFPRAIDYHARRGLGRKALEAVRTIYSSEARRGMGRLLDRRQPEIIHMHNIYHQLTPSILAPARERGIPVLLTLHDYKLACPVYTFLRDGKPCEDCLRGGPLPVLLHRCKDGSLPESAVLLAEALLHRLLRSYPRGVTAYTSPSRFLREKMIAAGAIGPDQIRHLPNALPFDAATLERPYEQPPAREAPEMLWVGRMSAEKGLHTLLAAIASSELPLRLLLVGDGPIEGELRRRAAELGLESRVRFLGRKDRAEIPSLIAASDGTVLPSEWYENAPLSLLESLALGRPVIASRIGGIPELLTEGETGWLFEPGDRDSLRGALGDWSESRERRELRGKRAFRVAREHHHPETVNFHTLEIYRSLLAGAR